MVGFDNTFCSNSPKTRPRSKTQRLRWRRKAHLDFTRISSIFNQSYRWVFWLMGHGAGPRTGPHEGLSLVGLSATSSSSPSSVFWWRWRLVIGFDTVRLLSRCAFPILWSFRGLLYVGFYHQVLLWVLLHLPNRHVEFLNGNFSGEELNKELFVEETIFNKNHQPSIPLLLFSICCFTHRFKAVVLKSKTVSEIYVSKDYPKLQNREINSNNDDAASES